MKVKVIFKEGEGATTFDMPEEQIRSGLDYAIRHNEAFWEVVRDVAGNYQAERTMAEMRRKMGKKRRGA